MATLLLSSSAARADVSVRDLFRAQALTGLHAGTEGGVLGRAKLPAIVELPEGADAASAGVERIGAHFGVVRAPLADLDALASSHPSWRVSWSSPLHPLLDKAAVWTGAPEFRNDTGLTGGGAIVGIIDTGADITHRDLRNQDGTTRIAYFIDYGQGPAGLEKEAESQCSSKVPCAVYSNTDIDDILQHGKSNTIPADTIGHGTHVASLAAGNGGPQKRYVGIAPEATLIVARAIDSSNQISDDTVLSAASLIFHLAEELGKPAVVNLSLGSDFGPHDGSSALERGLADLVGDAHPGRAIVVAAGNSAGLFEGYPGFPSPLGVHTDVSVPQGGSVEVPVVTPPPSNAGDMLSGTIFTWIAFRPGDDVGVGVELPGGELAPVQYRGMAGTFGVENVLSATVVVGSFDDLGLGIPAQNAAAVIIEGTWPKDQTFMLRFEGTGTASLWADAVGDIGADSGGLGALFPASTKESTITIPASHPDLIAVGATLNRTSWTDRLGDAITVGSFGGIVDPEPDSVAFFSSAGPTSDLRMKPDLLAPGAFVAGAMSRDADPRSSTASIFGETGTCMPASDCNVVDDGHAVSVGTSMAAPIVSGAVALLLEQNPDLTSSEVLTLLQAGARRPTGAVRYASQLGAGVLDLPGTLEVERARAAPVVREPSSKHSFLSLGATYAHPDASWSVPVLLQLRDAEGLPADGFDPEQLSVSVGSGDVKSDVVRAAPGLYRLAVAANDGTGGGELVVTARYRGHVLATGTLPIAVDVSTARQGFSARGGCSVGARRPVRWARGALWLAAVIIAGQRRRCSRAARRVRSLDRRGM